MFDIGLWEMVVIGVVALVVLGPERLPKVARTAGALMGRLQRYVAQVKADINREIEASELNKVKTELEQAAQSVKTEVEANAQQVERGLREAEQQIESNLQANTATDASTAPPSGGAASSAPAVADAPPADQLELAIDSPATPPRPAVRRPPA